MNVGAVFSRIPTRSATKRVAVCNVLVQGMAFVECHGPCLTSAISSSFVGISFFQRSCIAQCRSIAIASDRP